VSHLVIGTLFAADAGDPIDGNIYGTHPVYLDSRWYTKDATGELSYAADTSNASASYTPFTHGVFLRNAHAQEVLLEPHNVTWRTLGGTIDMYVYSGPSAEDVIKSYQQSTIGLPAMVPYWSLGFHQCRWGYANWSQLQEVVDNFKAFNLPLDTIWTDIDYMKQYRDFENDENTFPYDEGAKFLSQLHANDQHYIPIVDSAIYIPNPENASDAYATYSRGAEVQAFMLNPDGSTYIGEVWPGYTGAYARSHVREIAWAT
jgi:alpha-glucosidase